MASLLTAIEETLEQKIAQGIPDASIPLDPMFEDVFRTSQGVTSQGIGRGWKVKHTMESGVCGAVQWVSTDGIDTMTADGSSVSDGTDTSTEFNVYGDGGSWPTLSEMAGPSIIDTEFALCKSRINFPIPMTLMLTDKLDASVGSLVAITAKNSAKRCALSQVHAIWKTTATGTIGTISGGGSAISTGTTFTLTGGRIRQFYRGMFVNLYTDSGGSPGTLLDNSTKVRITNVDYKNKTVTIKSSGSTTGEAGTVHIVPVGAKTYGPNGLVDFLKTSGALFNAVNVSNYPEWKSHISTSYSGNPLTGSTLNKEIGAYEEATEHQLDTIVTTQGVVNGLIDNLEETGQLVRYPVQGQAINVTAGFQKLGYVYNGRTFKLHTSRYCPTGTVWVLKLGGGNLMKYAPPKLPGSTADSRFSGEVQFVGRVLGSNSMMVPVISSGGAHTENLQAPGWMWFQFAMREPRGIKLSTFTENI